MDSVSSDSQLGSEHSKPLFEDALRVFTHGGSSAFKPVVRMPAERRAAFMRFRQRRSERAKREAQSLKNRDITVFCLAAASVASVALGFTIMKIVTIAAISTVAPYVGVALALFFIIAAERIVNKQKQEKEPKVKPLFDEESEGSLADVERTDSDVEEEEESDSGQGIGLGSEDPFREEHALPRRDLLPPPQQDGPLFAPPPQSNSKARPHRRRSFHGADQRQKVDLREISQVAINIRPSRNGFLSTLMIDFNDPANREIIENLLRSMQSLPVGKNLELMPVQEQRALALRHDDLEIHMLLKGRWYHLQINPAFREAILARLSHIMPHPVPMRNSHGRELIPMQRQQERIVDCNGMLVGGFEKDCVIVDKADPFITYVERYCNIRLEVAMALKELGFVIIEAIQKGTAVPNQGNPQLQFCAVCWALMFYASHKSQAFYEGTFVLTDLGYRIFNYFLPSMYVRASSHFKNRAIPVVERKGWAHFGMDVDITSDFSLPAEKRHIMMGKIQSLDGRDRIYIKPENWGTNFWRPSHVLGHGFEFLLSQGRRRFSWLFGDVGLGDAYQKEHMLPDYDTTFKGIYNDKFFPKQLKPANEEEFWDNYHEYGLQVAVRFLLEISIKEELPNALKERVEELLGQLYRHYGSSLDSRKGNEVNLDLAASFMEFGSAQKYKELKE